MVDAQARHHRAHKVGGRRSQREPAEHAFEFGAVTGLNDSETLELSRFIEQLRAEGLTILLVEHDMGLVMRICSRVMVLAFGRKIADAEPAVVRADPAVLDAYLGTGDDE